MLDFTVAGLAVVVMGIALASRSDIRSAQIGVALINLVTLRENMKSLVKSWTMLETTIAVVSRIREFVGCTPQEQQPSEEDKEPPDSSGGMSIALKDVSTSYSQDGPDVLSSLLLRIAHGQKIAICGRSGSGKFSFLNELLRMTESSAGDLIILGRPSVSFGNQELRRRLNTIPQDLCFFPDAVRENLDPDAMFVDGDIKAQLAKVGSYGKVQELGGLEARLALSTFSAGQLQLLPLTRAMLRPKGILLLDEATSNVDNDTDKKIHHIMFDEFAGQTIVALLHRREQLRRFDHVAIIDNRKFASIGKPSNVNLKT